VVIENGRAVGIEYLQNGQARAARATRDIVLSGGSYNSPQLLMLSGIGPADELKALGIEPVLDLPGVGKNLQDHFTVMVEHKRKPVFPFDKLLRFDRMALAVMRWTLFRDGPATQFPAIGDAFYRTRPELEVPDIQFMFRIVSLDTRLWFPGVQAPALRKFNTRAICLHPESRGEVTLRSADPLAPPRIFFNAASEKKDVETLRAGIRTIREIFAQSPLAEMTDGEVMPGPGAQSDDEIDAYILKATGTSQHPVSTCRMGNDDMAVVGPDLKVRGIEGLRVADASVMPTEPTGAPNALVIMIGEKASDLILGRAPLPRAEV
jgi:choline dehydrogenase-like flavoprotein